MEMHILQLLLVPYGTAQYRYGTYEDYYACNKDYYYFLHSRGHRPLLELRCRGSQLSRSPNPHPLAHFFSINTILCYIYNIYSGYYCLY